MLQITKNDNSVTKKIDFVTTSVVKLMCSKGLSISSAESCTGGMFSAAITSVPGASEVFELGIVSYSNRIKEQLLGVPGEILESQGAVCKDTAVAMARNAVRLSGADIGVGITGIAGPTGAVEGKPVGTVFAAVVRRFGDKNVPEKVMAEDLKLYEELPELTRDKVRELTVLRTLEMVEQMCAEDGHVNVK